MPWKSDGADKGYYVCSECGLTEYQTEFYSQRKTKCKKCYQAYGRRYYAENCDRMRAYSRQRYTDNPNLHLDYSRKRYALNPEYWREWRLANPAKVAASSAARRANPMPSESRAFYRKCEIERPFCFYCGVARYEEMDHFIPVSKGGTNALENLRPSCFSCNRTKGNRLWSCDANGLWPTNPNYNGRQIPRGARRGPMTMMAWGECRECGFVGDMKEVDETAHPDDEQRLLRCLECGGTTPVRVMPFYPSKGTEEVRRGDKYGAHS